MKKSKRTPLLVCFAGVDGSGKTSQAQRLLRFLRSREMKVEMVLTNKLLIHKEKYRDSALHLLPNSHRDVDYDSHVSMLCAINEFRRVWTRCIKEKVDFIICDRYIESVISYAKDHGVELTLPAEIEQSYITPDLYFYLEIDPTVAISRLLERGKPLHPHENVSQLMQMQNYYIANKEDYSFEIINGNQPIDEVTKEVMIRFFYILKDQFVIPDELVYIK